MPIIQAARPAVGFLLLFFMLNLHGARGQGEGTVWYFGNKLAVDFNQSPPRYLANSQMISWEGTASIADARGNLLFYTNGIDVWNRNHQVMPTGSGLKGHLSSTQSALIVPKPGDQSTYYVFTTDEGGYYNPPNDGLHYSEVSLCLADGLGDVVADRKNIPLHQNTTEKLTATKHQNGIDYWVLAHEMGSNRFLAYLVTRNGVLAQPVVSAAGKPHLYDQDPWVEEFKYPLYSVGPMKLSVNGRRLGVAVTVMNYLAVFDFDPANGKVTNEVTLVNGEMPVYSFEFSPDGSKLYTNWYQSLLYEGGNTQIYQFDLNVSPAQTINTPATWVFYLREDYFSSFNEYTYYAWHRGLNTYRAFQLAPDGKIYVLANCELAFQAYTSGTKLAVINQPNVAGRACQINPLLMDLAPGTLPHSATFPTLVSSFLNPATQIGSASLCPANVFSFWIANEGRAVPADTVLYANWNFGDAASPQNQVSGFAPTHVYSREGTYTVSVRVTWMGGTQSTYTKKILVGSPLAVNLGKDTVLCQGQTLQLEADIPDGLVRWQDGSTASRYTVSKAGWYWVQACKNGCTVTDSVRVDFAESPRVQLEDSVLICDERPFTLSVKAPFSRVRWSTGSSQEQITVAHSGLYWVSVNSPCGQVSDTIQVTFESGPTVNLGRDTTLCVGQVLRLNATHQQGRQYFWQGRAGTAVYDVSTTGNYVVQVKGILCSAFDTISVHFTECENELVVPNVFTPNGDGVNETFEVKGILPGKWKLVVVNRFGKEVYQHSGYANDWNGHELPAGVYYYQLQDRDTPRRYRGWVQIMR